MPTMEAATELIDTIRARCVAGREVRRGVCLLNAGRYDEAAKCFSAASKTAATDKALPAYLAAALRAIGATSDAADALAGEQPRSTPARIRHALAQWSAGRLEEAIGALRDLIADDAENAEAQFQLGTLLAEAERFEEAELRFTQALNIDRDHTEAAVSLGMCVGMRGDLGQAVALLGRAQSRRPHDARIGLLLCHAARAAQQKGLVVRLHAAIDADLAADPNGIDELSKVIERDPDFVDAFLSVPIADVDEEVFAMLLRTLEIALERQPEHAELHFHCGRILARLGRSEEAIDEAERAVEIDPKFVRALIELGKLYSATDRHADAATRLEQAIEAGAEYADVYYLLGNLYRDRGDLHRARSAYRRALSINQRYRAAEEALAALPV